MFWRIATAVLVFIVAALGLALVGAALALFHEQATNLVGGFLEAHALILGLIVGICYFIWGKKLVNGTTV